MRRIVLSAIQLAAWFAVTGLIVLTVVPPVMRPESSFPSALEHVAAFFVAGVLNYLGYPRRVMASLAIAIAFAGGIELLQIPLPGRHARFTDFVIDGLAACAGNLVGFLLVRMGLVQLSKKRAHPLR